MGVVILSFSVKNFRSFKDEQIIDFTLAHGERIDKALRVEVKNKNENIRVLKNALIFGANASGKTNALEAIFSLFYLVTKPTLDVTEKFTNDTYMFSENPIEFKINLVIDGDIYRYEINFTENEVIFENLICNDVMIFKRHFQEFTYASIKDQMKEFLNQSVRKNALLLHAAQAQNLPHSVAVFRWFKQLKSESINYYFDMLAKDEKYKEKILYGLKFADFNIVDIVVERKKGNSDESTFSVYLVHKGRKNNFPLNLKFESAGTQQFFQLLLRLFDPNKNQVIIMDEFDRHIHKTLSACIIKMLNSEDNTLQFIATTHDSSLMDLLKKYQIYFVEKNNNGESELFSLGDFENLKVTRSDARFSPKYEAGLYGANQIINEAGLLALLREANNEED